MMKPLRAALLLFLGWTLMCCASEGDNLNQNTNADKKMPVPADPISFAPGTVRVTAVILDSEEKEKIFLCTFRIEETHGYGPATPPIPFGSEVKVEVTKFLLERNEIQASELLKEDNLIKATIRFQEPRPLTGDAVSWRAIQFDKNNDKRRDIK